jgi:hypothetical protein
LWLKGQDEDFLDGLALLPPADSFSFAQPDRFCGDGQE